MKSKKMNFDLRIVCGILALALVVMTVYTKPWGRQVSSRTITISGEASKKSEPDVYMFYPMYQKKGSDKAAIQAELAATINDVVAKVKSLGVDESDITLSSNTYDNYYNDGTNEVTTNSLTITVTNKDLSQKVQDYLATTAPVGQSTAQPSFSSDKRKAVESEVRSLAIADAKKKASSTASELGAKLGRVVSISDQNTGIMPMYGTGTMSAGMAEDKMVSKAAMPVLPGKQEINYNVQVVYELR